MFLAGKPRQWSRRPRRRPCCTSAGPVIAKVKVVIVLWGPDVPKTTTSAIKPFFKAITNSTYADQLSQYSTVGITGVNGDPGTNQTIVRGTMRGMFKITPINKSKMLTDADVQQELMAQMASGALPAADLNTLYMTYFPAGISITLDNLKSCVDFGALSRVNLFKRDEEERFLRHNARLQRWFFVRHLGLVA